MPNFSLADITGAISRLLDLPASHHAVSDLAGRVESTINASPEIAKSGLQSSALLPIVMPNLTREAADLMNPARHQELLRQAMERANPHSAEAAALERALHITGRPQEARGTSAASSSNYSDLPGGWTTAKLQSYAVERGVGWIANNPELLRLGPSAISLIAETQFKKEMYERLSKETGLSAKQIVGVVEYAKRTGQDATKVGGEVADVAKGLGGNDVKAQHDAGRIIADRLARPDDEAASQRFNELLDRADKDPATKPFADRARKLEAQTKKQQAATAKAGVDEAAAAKDKAEAKDLLSTINDTPATPKAAVKDDGASAAPKAQAPVKPAKGSPQPHI